MNVSFLEGPSIRGLTFDERLAMMECQMQDTFKDIKVYCGKNNIDLKIITEPSDNASFRVILHRKDLEDLCKCEHVNSIIQDIY